MAKPLRKFAGDEADEQRRAKIRKHLAAAKLKTSMLARMWVKKHGGDEKTIYSNMSSRLNGRNRLDEAYAKQIALVLDLPEDAFLGSEVPETAAPPPPPPVATTPSSPPEPKGKKAKATLAVGITINGQTWEATLQAGTNGFKDDQGNKLVANGDKLELQCPVPASVFLKVMQGALK